MKRDEAELEAATTERQKQSMKAQRKLKKTFTLTDLKADHNGLDN